MPLALPGYWKVPVEYSVDMVYPCWDTAVCDGGSGSEQCVTGHAGPYCGLCAEGWAIGAGQRCVDCGDTESRTTGNQALLTTLGFWGVSLIMALVFIGVERLIKALGKGGSGWSKFMSITYDMIQWKLKVVVTFFQIIATLQSTFNVTFPPSALAFVGSVRGLVDFNVLEVINFRCIVPYNYISSIVFMTATPIIIELGLCICLALSVYWYSKWKLPIFVKMKSAFCLVP